MNGMPSVAVISRSRPATSMTSASLSMTQGPAIKKSGRSGPTSKEASFMQSRAPGCRAARYSRAARMKPVNSGWPSRGVEVNSGWNWLATNHGWVCSSMNSTRPSARESRKRQAGRRQFVEIVIVELVAVAVPLVDRILAVERVHQRARQQARLLRAQAHAAAQVGLLVAHLLAARQILPLGDQRDHRMIRGAVEFGAVGALQAEHAARVFDDRQLHPQADAEIRNAILARIADRLDLALDAAVAEAAGHQDRHPCSASSVGPERSMSCDSK